MPVGEAMGASNNKVALEALGGSVALVRISHPLVHSMNNSNDRGKGQKRCADRGIIRRGNSNMRSNSTNNLNRVDRRSQITHIIVISTAVSTMSLKEIQRNFMKICFVVSRKLSNSKIDRIKLGLISIKAAIKQVVVIINMMISLNKGFQSKSSKRKSSKLNKKKIGKRNIIKVRLSNGRNSSSNSSIVTL
jgi:hypothetical protein